MRWITDKNREDGDYQDKAEEWCEAIKPNASDARRRIGDYLSGHQCRSDRFPQKSPCDDGVYRETQILAILDLSRDPVATAPGTDLILKI